MIDIEQLVKKFKLKGELSNVSFCDTGNINRTFIISMLEGDVERKYILQKINTTVFNQPYLLMKNINNVTEYCRNYLKNNNEDYERGVLNVIKTNEGENLYRSIDNEYYRMYTYIDNAKTYDTVKNIQMISNVGKAFGKFVRMLDGYPGDSLFETIPNFHNTRMRYNDFIDSIKRDPCDRVKNVQEEIHFFMERYEKFGVIIDKIKSGEIPVRVTHNDTKINNVLIDIDTNDGVCVIDLDTVMPGSALYDFGDAARSCTALTFEDDIDFEKVGINLDYFKAFTEAYLSQTKDILTKEEINFLAYSCILITLELSMRFLTDYINGDTYFKCNYEHHNLDRCRNQMFLAKDMEEKYEIMDDIIKETVGLKNKKTRIYKKYK